jgi:peptidylprolyl isomerase
MFDSSMIKNEPSSFGLNAVIKGWTDGIPLMSVGDKYRFWIPFEMAYKDQPSRPQGMLVFEVELLEIKEATAAPPGHGAPPGHPPHGGDPHGH